MKTQGLFLGTLIVLFNAVGIQGQEKHWTIDPDHSGVTFSADYMKVTDVSGEFTDYSGKVVTEGTSFNGAEIVVTIQAESIHTGNEKRDGHLRSEDFLHTDKYPEITFKSTAFNFESGDDYQLIGQLTLHGITKQEAFDVTYRGTVDMGETEQAGFELTGTVNRFDYTIDWNKNFTSGLVVGEEIKIKATVLLISEE